MLYFAYGSNTNLPAFRAYLRACGVDPRGVTHPQRAILHGYRPRTNYLRTHRLGAANIEPCSGARVEGVLMNITAPVLLALHRKEGSPYRYEPLLVEVQLPRSRRKLMAMTYVVTQQHRLLLDVPVEPEYRNLILEGAAEFGFTLKYRKQLDRLLRCA